MHSSYSPPQQNDSEPGQVKPAEPAGLYKLSGHFIRCTYVTLFNSIQQICHKFYILQIHNIHIFVKMSVQLITGVEFRYIETVESQ